MKKNILVLLMFIIGQILGQTSSKVILFYKPFTDTIETNLYRDTIVKFDIKTQYENMINSDIEKEVETAMIHNDYRIVGISGNSYLYPGLEGGYKTNKDGSKAFIGLDSIYMSYINKHGYKIIVGTSDVINPDNQPLQRVAYEYARNYNLLLLEKMKKKK